MRKLSERISNGVRDLRETIKNASLNPLPKLLLK